MLPLVEFMDEHEKRILAQWTAWPTRRVFVVRDRSKRVAGAAFVNDTSECPDLPYCNIDLIFVRPDASPGWDPNS